MPSATPCVIRPAPPRRQRSPSPSTAPTTRRCSRPRPANQNAIVGSAFSLVLPANTFTDVDSGDTLTYTATNAADGAALPAWLSFNAATRTFSGTPAAGDVGTLGVRVTADRSRQPRRQRDLQHRRVDDAEHDADGGCRHGRRHREGRRGQRLGRRGRQRQRAYQRHRSGCR